MFGLPTDLGNSGLLAMMQSLALGQEQTAVTGCSRDSRQDAGDGYPVMLIEDHGQDMRQAADGIDLEFFRSTAVE